MASDKTLLRLWVEWDFGQDSHVFESEEGAKRWLNERLLEQDDWPEGEDADFLFHEGLAGVAIVWVVSYTDLDG